MPIDLDQFRESVRAELRKVSSPEQHSLLDRQLAQLEDQLLLVAVNQLNRVPFVGEMLTAALAKAYAAGLNTGFKQGDAFGYQRALRKPQLPGRSR